MTPADPPVVTWGVAVSPPTLALAGALALDLAVAELPEWGHPVVWFGRAVAPLDRPWTRPRLVGGLAALVLPLCGAAVVAGAVAAAAGWQPTAGVALAAVAVFTTTSLRRLLGVAREVTALSETDLDGARERLRALAGRDASSLSPGQIRSAVVESLGENLADGFVAPVLAFAAGAAVGARLPVGVGPAPSTLALALGAGAAAWVKAVNTMDSMLGYRAKPVGWAPARLDDAVMWLPARVTALLLAVVAGAPGALLEARRWLDAVPSPNSGWPMGVLAAALAVRLEKPGGYVLAPERSLPTSEDATRARRLCGLAGGLAALLAGVVTWV